MLSVIHFPIFYIFIIHYPFFNYQLIKQYEKLFLLLATAFVCFACTNTKDVVTVTVSNPLAMERSNEMVEVAMSDIANQLKLADTAQIVVLNADGQQVPYQITYDEK